MTYYAIQKVLIDQNANKAFQEACQEEADLRQLTGSGVERGKAALKWRMENYRQFGTSERGRQFIELLDKATDRTSSKVLKKAFASAKKKIENGEVINPPEAEGSEKE